MKKLLLPLLACACVTTAAPAWADARSDETLGRDMQTYYKKPDPVRAQSIMQRLITHPTYKQQRGKTIMFNYWGASALQKYPAQTMAWCDVVRKQDAQTQLYASGLFFLAQTPDAPQCLQSLNMTEHQRQQLLASQPVDPLQKDIASPLDLDLLWMHFFATGNSQALHKIAGYVVANRAVFAQRPERPTQEDTRRLLVVGAARWSLRSNVQQDPQVRQILKQYAQNQGKAERAWLEREVLQPPAK